MSAACAPAHEWLLARPESDVARPGGASLPLRVIDELDGIVGRLRQMDDQVGSGTLLQLIQHGVTLQGGGEVTLSDDAGNVIAGTMSSVTLTNVDNTISGAGQLGNGQMMLINEGTIVATGNNALVIDTGANAVVNSGTLEATGSHVHISCSDENGDMFGGHMLSGCLVRTTCEVVLVELTDFAFRREYCPLSTWDELVVSQRVPT